MPTKNTAHTPGPWTVGNTNAVLTDIAAPNYTKAVATVWTRKRDPMDSKVTFPDAEGEANAKLIAAAPELLAALESIAETCSRGFPRGYTTETMLYELKLRAEEAIDKARGAA